MSKKFEINIDFLASYQAKNLLNDKNFKKCNKLFNIFDLNKDKQLNKEEIKNIFQQIVGYAEKNENDSRQKAYSIFDKEEAEMFINETKNNTGETLAQLGVTIKEVFEFLKILLNNAIPDEFDNEDRELESKSEESEEIETEPVELTDEQRRIAKELSCIPERKDNQFTKEECELLAQLPPEQLEKAKKFFYIESRQEQFSANEILDFFIGSMQKYDIPQENYARLPELLSLKDKQGNQLNAGDIMSILGNKTPEELDASITLLAAQDRIFNNRTANNINFIINSKSTYLYNLYRDNPEVELHEQEGTCYTANRDVREIEFNGKTYRFIIGQELPEEITREEIGKDVVLTIYNPNINQTQILTYNNASDDKMLSNPDKIETRHLDKDGNIEYTEFYENGEVPGTKNIYTIDKNGNRTDIQTSSVDKETGIQTIRKNYVSTDGVSTTFDYTANPQTNEYELTYEISNPEGTEPKILYSKHQKLEKTDEKSFTYKNGDKTYNITFSEDGIMQINDTSQNKTYEIDLNKLLVGEAKEVMAERFIRMPAEMLIFLSEHPLDKILYGAFRDNNGHFDDDNNIIEIGTQTDFGSDTELKDTIFSILMHEFGHFIDYSKVENIYSLSSKEEFAACFQEELDNYRKNHTSEEQNLIGQFSGTITMEGIIRGRQETVGEATMLLNTVSKEKTAARAYLLQRYFPKTIALVAKMIQERLQK